MFLLEVFRLLRNRLRSGVFVYSPSLERGRRGLLFEEEDLGFIVSLISYINLSIIIEGVWGLGFGRSEEQTSKD